MCDFYKSCLRVKLLEYNFILEKNVASFGGQDITPVKKKKKKRNSLLEAVLVRYFFPIWFLSVQIFQCSSVTDGNRGKAAGLGLCHTESGNLLSLEIHMAVSETALAEWGIIFLLLVDQLTHVVVLSTKT